MKQKLKKLKRILPKKVQTKRASLVAMALVILFSLISYDLLFKKALNVKAATLSTSSSAGNVSYGKRKIVITSSGVYVAFYNLGTVSPTGISYSTSTDSGSTWGSAIQASTVQSDDFSLAIDGSDNIYLVYTSTGIFFKKLTFSAGTWSNGSAVTITTTGCPQFPSVAINSAGTLEAFYSDCGGTSPSIFRSTNSGVSWTNVSTPGVGTNSGPLIVVGKSFWTISGSTLYEDNAGSGVYSYIPTTISGAGTATYYSMAYGLDSINIFFNDSGSNLMFTSFSLSNATFSTPVTISAGTTFDTLGTVVTDSHNIWAVWQKYVGTNSSNVVYKRFNGTSWDSSSTAITTDNLNNVGINTPARMSNTANVPVMWSSGTANPYNLKATTFSTLGSATDSGNQTGSLTGSLTGSSGDVIVKCGIWYYNTVNIVSGMTLKVCASNGVTGGSLEIHASTVTIAGTLDGIGRGLPGGVLVYGKGGAGGAGSTTANAGTGSSGTNINGSPGVGSFFGSNGNGGTSSTVGGGGGTDSTTGGVGGDGGGGSSSTGTNGSMAGYLGAGVNGDSTTDETLAFGSSGGGGGAGGSGAGGGGGGFGSSYAGGSGGMGAAGGYGGKGANAGAQVKIYSAGNISITGTISLSASTAASGGSGLSGYGGTAGESEVVGCGFFC